MNIENDKKQILSWWQDTRARHHSNRIEQEEDSRFCDGQQWTDEEITTLEERGQAPLVFNNILRIVRWYKGMFSEMKMDLQILPREESDIAASNIQTKVFKYLSDKYKLMEQWGRAFEDAVKVGIGWVEYGHDENDFVINYIPWREIYWDNLATQSNLSDTRYIFRVKHAFNDALPCDYKNILTSYPITDKTIILECWYKIDKEIRYAILASDGQYIQPPTVSPYPQGYYPFIPVWAYMRGCDNMPFGITRNIKDPQTDLNKRRSKALSLLIANQTIMEAGAVSDLKDFENELARPDGIIIKNPGREIEITNNIGIAKEHIQLADDDQQYIKDIAGFSEEILGESTMGLSGEAISLKQRQSYIVTKELFENLQSHIKHAGEYLLNLSRMYLSNEELSLITEVPLEKLQTLAINKQLLNIHTNFIVSLRPFAYSERRAQFNMMLNILNKLEPDVVLNLLDLLIDTTDFPLKDEMIRRIKQLNEQGYREIETSTRSAAIQTISAA